MFRLLITTAMLHLHGSTSTLSERGKTHDPARDCQFVSARFIHIAKTLIWFLYHGMLPPQRLGVHCKSRG